MQAMGKNSLMVYWVHVMLVYGSVVQPIKRTLSIAQGALAVVIVTVAMVAMSALWLAWKRRRAAGRALAAAAP
jgi:fucose 4-O-acetylase-like acetyltransferase